MKDSMTFEEQTEQIVEALFTSLFSKKQVSQVTDRCLKIQYEGFFEADSASNFNAVHIANILRSLGDQYNAELEGEQSVQALIAEKSKAKPKKFSEVAESLSRTWSSQTPGLEYERAFLAVAVKLFEYFIKKTVVGSGQINLLAEAINTNAEVRSYIERQGGWANLGSGVNNP
ncbi:bcl-2-like protein 15 [Python bivittatus]|uniref:Bcl-2-like protein 15 n=1 Tax=Python bivittatus TaxID=176946 RepID=A0A9F3W033_PYTBI|nr:bcl-2-like protein 15 [Python bivittatus]